jgi:hypothetical protein
MDTKKTKAFGDYAILALSFSLAPSGGIYMEFERGKPSETPNTPYREVLIKDERRRSAGPGFEPGRAGLRLSFRSSQDRTQMSINADEKECNIGRATW